MSGACVLPNARTSNRLAAPVFFAGTTLLLMVGSALLVGWAPVPFAFVTFFLLAGPHTWMEARYYFLARMPVRWGKLRGYFTLALAGTCVLSAAALVLEWSARACTTETCTALVTIWNAVLLLWILALVCMRRRQTPRRVWPWTFPLAGLLLLLNWLTPFGFSIGLAYVHPMMALWILDRELLRRRPAWRRAYHGCLCCVPLLLGWLWWQFANQPPLGSDDRCWLGGAECAGTEILPGLSSRFLVAAFAFLVMLHYCVWVVAFPLLGTGDAPWRLRAIPLAWRSRRWTIGVASVLVVAGIGVVLMWGGLLADFGLTSEVYLLATVTSVLAEVPFLLRTL